MFERLSGRVKGGLFERFQAVSRAVFGTSRNQERKPPATTGTFIPSEAEWIRSHYYDVPRQTVEFCGDLSGKCMLNLGCGEMLTDFGLLAQGVAQIVGLDLHRRAPDHLEAAAEKLRKHGIVPPGDYKMRIVYRCYEGTRFPFDDGQFEFVFSWSAFEHVRDVPAVLSELHRVLSGGGRAFIQVYPWYRNHLGSHLCDFIAEPYFHLTRQSDWVRGHVERYASEHPEQGGLVLNHMLPAYLSLNGYSADRFYRDVLAAGFRVAKARLLTNDLDISAAPPNVEFSDLMILGTMMLLKKTDRPSTL